MSNINDSYLVSKEQAETFRPTLLYRIYLIDGTAYYLTSANDMTASGMTYAGVSWFGNRYQSVIKNQNLGALQNSSAMGIDVFGSATIEIADTDPSTFWLIAELTNGFQGATMTVYFTLYDPYTNQFSPDYQEVFTGVCDPATRSANDNLKLTAVSLYSLSKTLAPPVPISRECPWNFPVTLSQRIDGAYNQLSKYWNCGYSPDVNGGVAGTYGPSGPYTSCAYTPSDCKARGMYDRDAGNRWTSRFGGVQWTPPATWKSKSYTQGKTIQGVNSINEQKWTQYVPLTFGRVWVDGICANVVGDANYTTAEVILGYGDYNITTDWQSQVAYVVVNGLLVPFASNTKDLLFRWYGQEGGGRGGSIRQGAIYNAQGDPYGGMLVINPVIYNQVAASNAPFSCRALLPTRPIPVYSGPGQYTMQRTDSPAWVIYELLRIARPDLYAQVDLDSVMRFSYRCAENISYRKADGTTGVHRRYGCSLAIQQPQSLASIIAGLQIANRLMIVRDINGGGVIRFLEKRALCDQQWAPVPGSNINDNPFFSTAYDGVRRLGYLGYDFHDGNVIPGTLQMIQDTNANMPVVFRCEFQDEDNQWTKDSVRLADMGAFNRINQLNTATVTAIGVPNADQAYRVLKTKQAEMLYANPTGQPRGALRWQFKATFRGVHLTTGMIVRLWSMRINLPAYWYRIEGIQPDKDFATATYTVRLHSDDWYTDKFGQV